MASRTRRLLRSRLWPTRNLVEGRHEELRRELGAVAAMVGELGEELAQLRSSAAALRQSTDAHFELLEERRLAAGAELNSRLRRTQALAARAYESLQGWPALLAQARARPDYGGAYADPEPLISIPIPTYHSPETLCRTALASVQAQTYRNWQAIVVGDHCRDDTEERVAALDDPRIRFYNLPVRENDPEDPWERWAVRGSVARSKGIELAQGKWIAPLSHDDQWDPDHLAALLQSARESRAEVAYSRMRMIRAQDRDATPFATCGVWPPARNQFAWQSAMFHGALRFLRYDRACALASEPNDWNLARRAWEAGVRFQFLDRETATLHVHPRWAQLEAEYQALGVPPAAAAYP
jgi:hypothetical protein